MASLDLGQANQVGRTIVEARGEHLTNSLDLGLQLLIALRSSGHRSYLEQVLHVPKANSHTPSICLRD